MLCNDLEKKNSVFRWTLQCCGIKILVAPKQTLDPTIRGPPLRTWIHTLYVYKSSSSNTFKSLIAEIFRPIEILLQSRPTSLITRQIC